jgi:hypothetical protein
MAVIDEMEAAGVVVLAGGLDEDPTMTLKADATSGTLMFTDGPYTETKECLGGLTMINVTNEAQARLWAGKLAEACGWHRDVRRFMPLPDISTGTS